MDQTANRRNLVNVNMPTGPPDWYHDVSSFKLSRAEAVSTSSLIQPL